MTEAELQELKELRAAFVKCDLDRAMATQEVELLRGALQAVAPEALKRYDSARSPMESLGGEAEPDEG